MENISITPDGVLAIDAQALDLPTLRILSIIGQGANGVVARARHRYLDEERAVKFWLTLRANDHRDKFAQGIEEARKVSKARGVQNVVKLFEAGEVGGVFYSSMEYFDGITLDNWLVQSRPSLFSRLCLSRSLMLTMRSTNAIGIYHGDLHPKNVLVKEDLDGFRQYDDFLVVDFGTSYFTKRSHSIDRHWKVLNRTINQLLYPLSINALWSHRAREGQPFGLFHWYWEFFDEIEPMLTSVGAYWAKSHAPYQDAIVRSHLNALVASGKLDLSLEGLGYFVNPEHLHLHGLE